MLYYTMLYLVYYIMLCYIRRRGHPGRVPLRPRRAPALVLLLVLLLLRVTTSLTITIIIIIIIIKCYY